MLPEGSVRVLMAPPTPAQLPGTCALWAFPRPSAPRAPCWGFTAFRNGDSLQHTPSPQQPSRAHPCGPRATMRPGPWMCSETFTEHQLRTRYKDKQIGNSAQRERHHIHTQVPALCRGPGWSTPALLAATPTAPKPPRPRSFSSPPGLCPAHHLLPTPPATLARWTERIQINLLCRHVTVTKFLNLSKPQRPICKMGILQLL